MILFFSGTGNSEYIAQKIGKQIGDEVINLFGKIKAQDYTEINSEKPWIIVAPTYAWQIPKILEKWLKHTPLKGNKDIYYLMTCGGNIGNAGKYLKTLTLSKNMNYLGTAQIVMPENYIALFSTPTEEEARKTIKKADIEIEKIVNQIKTKSTIKEPAITTKDKLNSSLVNKLFYPIVVKSHKFYAKDSCISCGKCAKLCPLNNITIKQNKPTWQHSCTHCMACISYCPKEAIEYGKNSLGKPRYTCQKTLNPQKQP